MDVTVELAATLRAQMSGHPPLVIGGRQGGAETSGDNQPMLFENHGVDSRCTGPLEVAPTMSARYGTGGNNTPLVSQISAALPEHHPEGLQKRGL